MTTPLTPEQERGIRERIDLSFVLDDVRDAAEEILATLDDTRAQLTHATGQAAVIAAELREAVRRVKQLRTAVAEAGIVLEALWLAEHDGRALAPAVKDGISAALFLIRSALAETAPDTQS